LIDARVGEPLSSSNPAGKLLRYPEKSLAGTVTAPVSLISAGNDCSRVSSRSVARTRILPSPSALSKTFERIGTVVCALTILLAAPTAVAMSFVLHVNFTNPPFCGVPDAFYKK
jgi:hypothetical protein